MVGFLALLFQSLYTVSVIGLALYGAHALWLTWRLHRQGGDVGVPEPAGEPS